MATDYATSLVSALARQTAEVVARWLVDTVHKPILRKEIMRPDVDACSPTARTATVQNYYDTHPAQSKVLARAGLCVGVIALQL